MNAFFYGLFMDQAILASKGIIPEHTARGHVDGFELQIGQRATLIRSPGARTYGVLMEIAADELKRLYSDGSVADYRPETLTVNLDSGSRVEATCYNLPAHEITGTNKAYARALHELARRLELNESYVEEIGRLADEGE